MSKMEKLPEEFKQYFWEYDFEKINLAKGLNLVIARILSFGDMRAVKWLFKNAGREKIKAFILSMGDRQLDRRSNNFWRIILDLPQSPKPVNPLWPY